MNANKNETKFSFDDIKKVMHHLRHSCEGVESAKYAIERISRLTGMDKNKVESVVIQIGSNSKDRLNKLLTE